MNLVIVLLFTVFIDINEGPYCNETTQRGLQKISTAVHVVRILNKYNYVPDMSIGIFYLVFQLPRSTFFFIFHPLTHNYSLKFCYKNLIFVLCKVRIIFCTLFEFHLSNGFITVLNEKKVKND